MAGNESEKVHTADVFVAKGYEFSRFHLSDKLLQSLHEMNFVRPSPIQVKIIPLARSRLDMIIQSKSGTGKTLAFSICLLETYEEDLKFPQAVIIVPTREIAVQITNILEGLGRHLMHFKTCEFIGGTDLKNDRKRIQTCKIVVGRLKLTQMRRPGAALID
jgi:ATP-dependent RNA helicase DDX20